MSPGNFLTAGLQLGCGILLLRQAWFLQCGSSNAVQGLQTSIPQESAGSNLEPLCNYKRPDSVTRHAVQDVVCIPPLMQTQLDI